MENLPTGHRPRRRNRVLTPGSPPSDGSGPPQTGTCAQNQNPPQKTAVAYYRTSSATNVGHDKDSLKRQQDACKAYAAFAGIPIVQE